jgi:hypothetical protein
MPIVTAGARPLARSGSSARGPSSASHDRQPGAHQVDHGLDQVGRQHRVEWRGHQPGLGDPDLGQVRLDRVLAEHQHHVTMLQTGAEQRVRYLVRQLVGLQVAERRVPLVRVRAGPADDRGLVRPAPRHPLQQVADTHPLTPVHGPPVVQARHVEFHDCAS